MTWNSPIRPDWLVIKPQGPPCPYHPSTSTGLWLPITIPCFFMCILGIKLVSSGFHSKQFTNWTLTLAPHLYIFRVHASVHLSLSLSLPRRWNTVFLTLEMFAVVRVWVVGWEYKTVNRDSVVNMGYLLSEGLSHPFFRKPQWSTVKNTLYNLQKSYFCTICVLT